MKKTKRKSMIALKRKSKAAAKRKPTVPAREYRKAPRSERARSRLTTQWRTSSPMANAWTITVEAGETAHIADNVSLYAVIQNRGPGINRRSHAQRRRASQNRSRRALCNDPSLARSSSRTWQALRRSFKSSSCRNSSDQMQARYGGHERAVPHS